MTKVVHARTFEIRKQGPRLGREQEYPCKATRWKNKGNEHLLVTNSDQKVPEDQDNAQMSNSQKHCQKDRTPDDREVPKALDTETKWAFRDPPNE